MLLSDVTCATCLTTDAADDSALLPHQAWLLKAVALELKLTSANKQRSHAQRLMTLLLDDNPAVNQRAPDGVYEPDYSTFDNEFSLYTSQTGGAGGGGGAQGLLANQSRRKILALLDSIDFAQVSRATSRRSTNEVTALVSHTANVLKCSHVQLRDVW